MFVHKLTDDVELRPLDMRHCEEMFELIDRNRAYLRRYLEWVDGQKSVDDARAHRKKMLHKSAEDGTIVVGIWYKGCLSGVIGFHPTGPKCWEIGYWLGEEYQGKGLITMSCRALIRHAFKKLNANRIEIRVEPMNDRSRAVPERLGFTHEGTLRQKGMNADGKFVDMMMHSLLKEEWED